MHILVTNDDGPPSTQSSPYVHSLVSTLQSSGHKVSVILPHTQRSWIGKAHFVGQTARPTYFIPGTLYKDNGTVHEEPLPKDQGSEEWVLIDGTPATCAQLGLYHFFQDRGPVDLVVSGPNYGRNCTALFSLSSGTIGGAMEAAVCGKRAIALSYAFYSRNHDPDIIAEASRLSTRLIEHLSKSWGHDVDLYSINVPLIKGVESNKVEITSCLPNLWRSGSSFKEIDPGGIDPRRGEKEIRESDSTRQDEQLAVHGSRLFKWAPSFSDVYQSVEESGSGSDGWTINQGMTSVTPMKAKFAEACSHPVGELKLTAVPSDTQILFYAYVAYGDPYVQTLIMSAFNVLPSGSHRIVSSETEVISALQIPCLHITPYEELDHSELLSNSAYFGNAYTIRKALIRKHYLANTVKSWLPKNPGSLLKTHVPLTIDFELDYAEFLEDALIEEWELHESFARNEGKPRKNREWWILKPGMSDRGQGIRLFSSLEDLTGIFEEWEAENPESDDNDSYRDLGPEDDESRPDNSKGLIISQLRHFVAQPYISPLLLQTFDNRKFHIRSYVLCVGALSVYVYKDMLALFASDNYNPPGWDSDDEHPQATDMRRHLTNTCLQDGNFGGSVLRYWSLPLPNEPTLSSAFNSICCTTAELFRASAANPISFQPLPSAFEIFGIDWLLDDKYRPWLLEVNAFPDFKQTGDELRDIVAGFWEGVIATVGRELLRVGTTNKQERSHENMVQVLELDLGRR